MMAAVGLRRALKTLVVGSVGVSLRSADVFSGFWASRQRGAGSGSDGLR